MNLRYRNVDYESSNDCQFLANWENDPKIRHLINVFRNPQGSMMLSTPEDVMARKANLPKDRPWRHLMVLNDQEPIGEVKFEFDPKHLITKDCNTAWFSIVIGAPSARGIGLGKMVMMYIEDLAIRAGARKFEIGAFEFNAIAIGLYKAIGYREIERIPEFTYWDRKMWADVRMVKSVTT